MKTVRLKSKQAENHLIREVIKKVVTRMVENSVNIVNADMVVRLVREEEDAEVSTEQVKKVIKDDMGMAYRMTRKIPV